MTTRKKHGPAFKARVFLAAEGRCHLCAEKITELWELEHVIPLALGGEDTEANCRPAHKVCHAAKTRNDRKAIAKVNRIRAREDGTRRERRPIKSRGFSTNLTRKMDGSVVRKEPA